MRNNPFDYKLPMMKSWEGSPAAFKPFEKKVKLICMSFMKRTRAAYKHGEMVYRNNKLMSSNIVTAACDLEEHINGVYEWVMHNLPLKGIKWDDGRTLLQVATEHITYVNNGLKRMHAEIKEFERYVYRKGGSRRFAGTTESHREYLLRVTKEQHKLIHRIYLNVRRNYPYVREKYRSRLMRLSLTDLDSDRMFTMVELLKAGIPAVDIVGPWWPRVQIPQIKGPMDYIDWVSRHGDIPVQRNREYGQTVVDVTDNKSPTVKEWVSIIDLDSNDRELVEACFQYYLRHKAAPSVQWARERSNQLEEERSKKEVEGQIPSVKMWLEFSEAWLKSGKIMIPILPGPEWKVLGSEDARKLCATAKRDGLCVVDVISSFVEGDPHDSDHQEESEKMRGMSREARIREYANAMLEHCDDEGVCSIILCTDPKRRTVVGLNKEGVCTSEHHCTGVQNKVDKEAWKYFKER